MNSIDEIRESMSSMIPSVVVIRFKDLGWFGKYNWLGSGISNTLTEKFRYLPFVRVLSLLAVDQLLDAHRLRGIPLHKSSNALLVLRELPVDVLVYGTLRVKGSNLEMKSYIIAKYMRVANLGWSGSYLDLLDAINKIARQLVETLSQEVSRSAKVTTSVYDKFMRAGIPCSLNAYEMFSKGTHTRFGPEREYFYRQAIKIDPSYGSAYAGLGTHYAVNNRAWEAKKCFEKQVELAPHDHQAYSNLGMAYGDLGYFNAAQQELQKAIERYPQGDPDVFCNLGAIYQLMEQADDAIVQYQKALELNPDDPDVCVNIGKCYLLKGDRYEAKRWLQKGIDLYGPMFRHKRERNKNLLNSI